MRWSLQRDSVFQFFRNYSIRLFKGAPSRKQKQRKAEKENKKEGREQEGRRLCSKLSSFVVWCVLHSSVFWLLDTIKLVKVSTKVNLSRWYNVLFNELRRVWKREWSFIKISLNLVNRARLSFKGTAYLNLKLLLYGKKHFRILQTWQGKNKQPPNCTLFSRHSLPAHLCSLPDTHLSQLDTSIVYLSICSSCLEDKFLRPRTCLLCLPLKPQHLKECDTDWVPKQHVLKDDG